jgi:hypothetical protein
MAHATTTRNSVTGARLRQGAAAIGMAVGAVVNKVAKHWTIEISGDIAPSSAAPSWVERAFRSLKTIDSQ